jgi:hypothetical protein
MPQALDLRQGELFGVVQEHRPEVLMAALRYPDLDENHLLPCSTRRGLTEELFNAIYANRKLLQNNKVKSPGLSCRCARAYCPDHPLSADDI